MGDDIRLASCVGLSSRLSHRLRTFRSHWSCAELPVPEPGPARSCCGCPPAACATPSWTRSRAARRRRGCRWSPATRWWAASRRWPGRGRFPRRRARGRGLDLFGLRHVRVLPLGPREPLPRLPRHGARRRRRLRRVHGGAGATSPTASRPLHRCAGRAAAVRGRDRLPVAPPDRAARRPAPGADGLRRLGPPGAEDGAPPLSDAAYTSSPAPRPSAPSPCDWAPPGPGRRRTAPGAADASSTPRRCGQPVVEALRNLAPGGRLVINAIRKEDADKEALLRLDYPAHLWMEREIKSVANVHAAGRARVSGPGGGDGHQPEVQEYALEDANQALIEFKRGRFAGRRCCGSAERTRRSGPKRMQPEMLQTISTLLASTDPNEIPRRVGVGQVATALACRG